GGEAQNTSGYDWSFNGGYITLMGILTTQDGGNGMTIGGGFVEFVTGRAASGSTPLVMTGGVANFSPSFTGTNFTISGSAGTVYIPGPAGLTSPYGAPNVSSFTGTLIKTAFPAQVATTGTA